MTFPHLDEFEDFEQWRRSIDDWETCNRDMHEEHKIIYVRTELSKRRTKNPDASCLYLRFARVEREFSADLNWRPFLTDILDRLGKDHYEFSEREALQRERHKWKIIAQYKHPKGTTKPEILSHVIEQYEKLLILGEKLDIHDLTHKIMEIKLLASEALKLIVFQPNAQIKQIENFFYRGETI